MTLDEIEAWMKRARRVDRLEERDEQWTTSIFELEGKLYVINFCNSHPLERWDRIEGAWIRGEIAEPQEVIKKERVVTQTYYETLDGTVEYGYG
jgi:hypothetical protein